MTIQIKVTDEEMKLLQEAAQKQGVSVENVAERSLRAGLAQEVSTTGSLAGGEESLESCFGIFEGNGKRLTNSEMDRLIAEEAMDTHKPNKKGN